MNSSIFINNLLTENIKLHPNEINNDYEKKILNKLKKKIEGICTKNGYIRKNSINIVKLSTPIIIAEHFNRDIVFDVHILNSANKIKALMIIFSNDLSSVIKFLFVFFIFHLIIFIF